MNKRMRFLRRDLLGKVATVAIGAAALAGCSSATERFGPNPYYTASTKNQQEIMNGSAPAQPSYQDIVNGPGGTVAGLPQSTTAPVSTASIPRQPQPTYTAPRPVAVTAAPQVAKVPTQLPTLPAPEVAAAGKSWKGWSAGGGSRITARDGDTLASISRRYGVPIQAVASVNGLQSQSSLRPGQTLIIPTYGYADRNGASSRSEGEGRTVTLPASAGGGNVVTGSIPNVAGAAPRPERKPYEQPSFAQLTKSAPPAAAVVPASASALPKRKPGDDSDDVITASVPGVVPGGSVPAPRRQPADQTASTRVDVPRIVETNRTAPAQPVAPAAAEQAPQQPIEVANVEAADEQSTSQFRWPVRGRIISDFGAKPGGGRNEGVNLAVPEGTPVKAANDGTVIYAGNELKGYGNLVLVRHEDGWVSAYAHNSVLNVKRGDKVRRGEPVALAGATGSVNQPQVHFELRQGNKPVDPLKYLPRR